MSMSLAHVLGQLNVSASGFATVDVAGRWAPAPVGPGQAHLLIILRGHGELQTAAATAAPVAAGKLLVLNGTSPLQLRAAAAGVDAAGPALRVAHGVIAATLLNGQCVFDFITLPHGVDLADSELFTSAVPELIRESNSAAAGADAIVSCLVRRIVTHTLRDAWPDSPLVPLVAPGRQGALLQGIVDSMSKDPGRSFTLDSLAAAAGMSRTAFHNAFSKTYGKSPLALLRGIRLKKAEELLTYTDLPVKAIAARLGYLSRSYFSRTYKAAYGVDPEGYRNASMGAAP